MSAMRWAVGWVTGLALAIGCSSQLARPRSDGGSDAAIDRASRPIDARAPGGDATPDIMELAPLGSLCLSGIDCQTGFCVDGVCCNTSCNGPCVTCAGPGGVGTCLPVAAGLAARVGGCPAGSPATCGMTGLCDGVGGCALYAAGTLCVAAACVDGTTLQAASICDGLGTCRTGPTLSCAPFTCVEGACFADDCQQNPADCPIRPNRDASVD